MKMMKLLLLLGIVVLGQCQDLSCIMDENPVTACTAAEILQYIQQDSHLQADFFSVSILTDVGSSCDDLISLLQEVKTTMGSGSCLPASVSADDEPEGRSGAAETGDPEDDAITEVIDEPHNSPGEEPVVRDDPGTAPTQAPDPPSDPECYTEADGSDYFGDVSVTESGLECQSWAERTPHRPIIKYRGYGDPMHPSHFGPHNHCRTLPYMAVRRGADRNNYSGRTGPWCYTMDPSLRWEYCNVGEPQDSC